MNETNYHIYKAKQISFVATNLIYLPQDESMQIRASERIV